MDHVLCRDRYGLLVVWGSRSRAMKEIWIGMNSDMFWMAEGLGAWDCRGSVSFRVLGVM